MDAEKLCPFPTDTWCLWGVGDDWQEKGFQYGYHFFLWWKRTPKSEEVWKPPTGALVPPCKCFAVVIGLVLFQWDFWVRVVNQGICRQWTFIFQLHVGVKNIFKPFFQAQER